MAGVPSLGRSTGDATAPLDSERFRSAPRTALSRGDGRSRGGSPVKFIVSVMPVSADKAPKFISAAARFLMRPPRHPNQQHHYDVAMSYSRSQTGIASNLQFDQSRSQLATERLSQPPPTGSVEGNPCCASLLRAPIGLPGEPPGSHFRTMFCWRNPMRRPVYRQDSSRAPESHFMRRRPRLPRKGRGRQAC
jgi:hypothetical protein